MKTYDNIMAAFDFIGLTALMGFGFFMAIMTYGEYWY
jgi:hypothetical protein